MSTQALVLEGHNLQHILQFLPPHIRSLALLTCWSWYKIIRYVNEERSSRDEEGGKGVVFKEGRVTGDSESLPILRCRELPRFEYPTVDTAASLGCLGMI